MSEIYYKYWENKYLGRFILAFYKEKLVYLGTNNESFSHFINKSGFIAVEKPDLSEIATIQLDEYILKKRKFFEIPFEFIVGTAFQKSVWHKLMNIPYGKAVSYKELALSLGSKNLSRAVGQANSKNPIPIIVPCHRVISSDKSIGGYSLGLEVKRQLLDLESIDYSD